MGRVSEQRTSGNVRVDGLGITLGATTRRLDFPRAEIEALRGEAGSVQYGAAEVSFERLAVRLAGVHWSMESGSAGDFWVRDAAGRFELQVARIEAPRGVLLTRSAVGGVELAMQHASLSDVRLVIPDLAALRTPAAALVPEMAGAVAPSGDSGPTDAPAASASGSMPAMAAAPPEPPGLRQDRLRFLDAVHGDLAFRLKVVLDLPVLGTRTLDQTVKVDISEGAFDFKKLDDRLTWLEGAFLDIGVDNGRFRVGWGVPLFQTKEIISWALDGDAATQAAFDRIPLRALADFRLPRRPDEGKGKNGKDKGRGRLKALTLGDLAVSLSMAAPRNLDVAGGTIRFGGEDEPGIVDLKVGGSLVHPPAPGKIDAVAGALDMTLKDIQLGGMHLSADRMHVGPVDSLEVTFDGFQPVGLVASLHRVSATNLVLLLGSS